MAAPFSQKLPWGWLLIGTLVPDLIDKPLYYGLHFATGLSGDALGVISCTRTVGHSGILLLVLAVVGFYRKSKPIFAILLGMITHLLLDGLQDAWYIAHGSSGAPATLWAVLFPYFGRFAPMPFDNLHDHLATGSQPLVVLGEVIGMILLVLGFRRRSRSAPTPRIR